MTTCKRTSIPARNNQLRRLALLKMRLGCYVATQSGRRYCQAHTSRAAAENIIPTSTGAAKAVGEVLPELQGKLHGIAARVPVPDGSVVDLFAKLKKKVLFQDVHDVVKEAAQSESLQGILQYTNQPIVSTDIIGNSHSSIYDSGFTDVTGGRYVRVLNWYDNEWGYANRVCDLLAKMNAWYPG